MFEGQPLAGVCIFNFVAYNLPHDPVSNGDLDMASYGIVKVLPAHEQTSAVASLPWEPKASFRVVAEHHEAMAQRA